MSEPLNRAYLVLGSNIEPERHLPAAVAALAGYGCVEAVSGVWQSPPADGSEQPDYLNAAVLLQTTLTLAAVYDRLIPEVEQRLKRRRVPGNPCAARTIDVDLALFNDWVARHGRHCVPDPDVLARPFVAVPLAELAPDYVHPQTGETLQAIAARLSRGATLQRRDDVSEQLRRAARLADAD